MDISPSSRPTSSDFTTGLLEGLLCGSESGTKSGLYLYVIGTIHQHRRPTVEGVLYRCALPPTL
jgi:hypothetical protein